MLAAHACNRGRLGDALALLADGAMSVRQVWTLDDLTATLDDAHALAVAERVLPKAGTSDPSQFRRLCRRALVQVEPDAIRARHREAVKQRGVCWWAVPDGMATLAMYAPAYEVQGVYGAIELVATPANLDPADTRLVGARRCDALRDLCLAAIIADDTASGTSRTGVKAPVEVQVVIDLPTLAGLADHPGELAGYGPIPAGLARDWLTEPATWRRLVTDPVSGHLLDYGPKTRFAPPKLRAFLAARDRTCTFPGCHRRADGRGVEMDHHPPWQPNGSGGATSASQMGTLCAHHHHLRTHGGWKLQTRTNGVSVWTSPTGRDYTTESGPPFLPTGHN